MCLKLVLALCVLKTLIHAIPEVTFTEVNGEFKARILYQRSMNSHELCLSICYDDERCRFVHFSENNCTIYKFGYIAYLPCEVTYKLDRKLRSTSCTFEIPIRQTVQFERITKQYDKNVTCTGLPPEVTSIHMYLLETWHTIYSISDLIENVTNVQRLLFAKNPQSHCISVPVFTGESSSRLYFGNVYNTSGYHFLDAYAFTGKCACENGACCGIIAIDECLSPYYKGEMTSGYVYAGSKKPKNLELCEATSKQKFYIADEEWF